MTGKIKNEEVKYKGRDEKDVLNEGEERRIKYIVYRILRIFIIKILINFLFIHGAENSIQT